MLLRFKHPHVQPVARMMLPEAVRATLKVQRAHLLRVRLAKQIASLNLSADERRYFWEHGPPPSHHHPHTEDAGLPFQLTHVALSTSYVPM